MAKLTIDEAKVKLLPIEKAIESLKSMNVEVPTSLQTEYDRLVKVISGNANVNVAQTFNEKIAVQINGNEAFKDFLIGQIGTSAKLKVVVVTAEDGSKSIKFEASSGTGGGSKSGTSTGGGTKASTPYNNYVVTVIGELPEYASKTGTFTAASKAVEFILNGGKNPMSLGAEWQKGNSMVRALEALAKNEVFAKNFTLECSYIAPVKKEEAIADSTPATV